MKKLLSLTLCLLMVMASASFATNTRVLTMGENNEILLDEANIWLYPSRIFDYPDMVVADFRSYSDFGGFAKDYSGDDYYFHDFGVHWKFGEEKPWVLGTYFSNSEGQVGDEAYLGALNLPVGLGTSGYEYPSKNGYALLFPSGDWGQPPYLGMTDSYTNRRIGLFYARMLGKQKFGFSFQYLHSSANEESDEGDGLVETYNQSFTRYNIGLGLTEGLGKWDVGANIQFITWTDEPWDFTEEVIYERTKPAGNMVFDLQGRYFHPVNSIITLVPHAKFMYGKFESEVYDDPTNGPADPVFDTDPDVYKYNIMSIQGACGMHYQPTANMLAVLDFGVAYTKFEAEWTQDDDGPVLENDMKVFTRPYFRAGFEGQVFNWMDVRFGATSYWHDFEEEAIGDGTTGYKYSENFPDNMTYLGFSFNWGNLTVDTWSDPELFLNGLNFISGDDDEDDDMNAGLSAIYSF